MIERQGPKFVNPYSFVPFPQGSNEEICPRSKPAGHHRLRREAYSGVVKI